MCYGTDVFVFDPKILNKIFWEKCLSFGNIPPEAIIFKAIDELDILVLVWTRMFITVEGQRLCAPTPESLGGAHYRSPPFADEMNIQHTHNLNTLNRYL